MPPILKGTKLHLVIERRPADQWKRDRELRDRARENRQWQTGAEKVLWLHLRTCKADGWHFRRQHPINEFIVDFCCPRAGLVVELDGDVHLEPEAQEYDRWRQTRLEALGWTVIRFRNDDVLAEPGEVRACVLAVIAKNLG